MPVVADEVRDRAEVRDAVDALSDALAVRHFRLPKMDWLDYE